MNKKVVAKKLTGKEIKTAIALLKKIDKWEKKNLVHSSVYGDAIAELELTLRYNFRKGN
jgi:hypothetical protein